MSTDNNSGTIFRSTEELPVVGGQQKPMMIVESLFLSPLWKVSPIFSILYSSVSASKEVQRESKYRKLCCVLVNSSIGRNRLFSRLFV